MAVHTIEVAVTDKNGNTIYEEESVQTTISGNGWVWEHIYGNRAPGTPPTHGPFRTEEDAIGDACRSIGGSWKL
ncbi:hypothetical protein CRT60_01010 [Azospirillum palustre]|uniref:Uncharacterized protein n=1 Tax=Azospirillum palustre TaxID=2044885 RepID=A0A2B8BP98_9PROT|nr:hypothetical protein [Azospirillum palustre]PGH59242.1 hypothetical protein CRT60_01010 [Azospirillum palustre]